MPEYSVGDPVVFGRKHGEKTAGTILKVNRKTCRVRQDESRGTMKDHAVGTVWTVPFLMLEHDPSDRSMLPTSPAAKSDDVVGATIVKVRPMTNVELSKESWGESRHGRPTALVLSNGTVLYASQDEEGNGAGALFGVDIKGRTFGLRS